MRFSSALALYAAVIVTASPAPSGWGDEGAFPSLTLPGWPGAPSSAPVDGTSTTKPGPPGPPSPPTGVPTPPGPPTPPKSGPPSPPGPPTGHPTPPGPPAPPASSGCPPPPPPPPPCPGPGGKCPACPSPPPPPATPAPGNCPAPPPCPSGPNGGPPNVPLPGCLDDKSAETWVNNFIKTLQISGNDTAAFAKAISAVANDDVQEISDSVNFLANKPYGTVSLNGIGALEAFHSTSPPGGIYQVTTLNIWHTCDVIVWRWLFVLYPGAKEIRGINVFELGKDGKADLFYDEFNSAVWAQNLGYTITPPAAPPS